MAARKSVVPATPENVALSTLDSDEAILAEAASRFTREATLAACESAETATAYASEALTAWQATERHIGAVDKRRSVWAAEAAYAAVKAGLLVETKGKDAAEGVMDAKAWGEQWITEGKPEGVSRPMVVTWIRAGQAFMDWSVDPESPEGKRLLGGLAQGKEWNARRAVIAETVAELTESGEDIDPEALATMATEAIAEVRAEAEAAAAKREAERVAAKEAEAKRVKEALAKKSAESKSGTLPESLDERRVLAEQVIAALRPAIKAEREILLDLAARIAAALDQHAADVA